MLRYFIMKIFHLFNRWYFNFILNTPSPFGRVIRYLRMLGVVREIITSTTPAQFEIITSLQKKYNIDILVETGTYLGEMVWAQLNHFKEIYSIELNESLYQKAVKRFQIYPQVKLIQGDSGKELVHLVPKIKKRSIFFLDGQYSQGETSKGDKSRPILEELKSILQSEIKDHILVIVSIRLFDLEKDYPTFKELYHSILKRRPQSKTILRRDMFIVIPL